MSRAVILIYLASAVVAFGLGVGSTREEVITLLGEPTVTARKGPTEMLYYSGGVIDIRGGKVARLDAGFDVIIAKRSKGLVKYDGKWMTTQEVVRLEGIKAAGLAAELAQQKRAGPPGRYQPPPEDQPAPSSKVMIISNGGKRVELAELLVPGKITVIDFYANWCAPCRKLSPSLEAIANENEHVYLRMVNIVNWESEVAGQYGLHSIPNVRVYDRQGRLVGEPSANGHVIARLIQEAR